MLLLGVVFSIMAGFIFMGWYGYKFFNEGAAGLLKALGIYYGLAIYIVGVILLMRL